MSRPPRRPRELRGRVFRGRAAVEAGLLTPRQLQGQAWCRLFQGIYADSSLEITYGIRCAVAIAFVAPRRAVVAGRSAALLYGVGVDDSDGKIEILVPRAAPIVPRAGLTVHESELWAGDWQEVQGLLTTTPIRTCWDLARWLPPVEAVVRIDRILRGGLVTHSDLASYLSRRLAERPRARGLRRFARVMALVDGTAESPQESRLRVRLVLAGLPRPIGQLKIYDRNGVFVARVDLAWEEYRLVLEYDGLWHVGSAEQMHDDRKRLNALTGLGWTVLHVTAARLRDDFDALVREIRAAMRVRRP